MQSVLDRAEFDRLFREFVAEIQPEFDLAKLEPDLNLFDAGVFDSLSVAQAIVFLEKVLGHAVDLEGATIEAFSTPGKIYTTFVE